jgi:heat shock protein HslJ
MRKNIGVALLLAVMGAATRAEAGDVDLLGTAWLAREIGGQPVIDSHVRSTMGFVEAGKVSGEAGCNRYFGPVAVDADAISFADLAATRMMCPDAQMDQEQRFLQALSAAKRLSLTGDGQMLLIYADGPDPIIRLARITDK